MDCPDCQAATRVVETRSADAGAALRRRRECPSCGRRFTTYERHEAEPLRVRKRGGERERFDPLKLRAALLAAAHKRPVRADQIEQLVGRIEAEIGAAGGELSSRRIGELCLAGLARARRRRLPAVPRRLRPRNFGDFGGVFAPGFRPGRKRGCPVTRTSCFEERERWVKLLQRAHKLDTGG